MRWHTIWERDGIRYATRGDGRSSTIYAVYRVAGRAYAHSTGVAALAPHKRRDVETIGRRLRGETEKLAAKPVNRHNPVLAYWAELDGKRMIDDGLNAAHARVQLDRWAQLIAYFGDGATLGHVTTDKIASLCRHLREDRGHANQTVRRYLTLIKRAFRWADERGLVYDKPRWPRLLDDDEGEAAGEYRDPREISCVVAALRGIAQEAPSRRHRAAYLRASRMIEFALHTGMRAAELGRLRFDQCRDCSAHLSRSGTKTKRRRVVPLTPEARAVVDAQRETVSGDLVFGSTEIRKSIESGCGRARVRVFSLRDLRHTCATHAGRLPGMTLGMLMDWFGWSNAETAQRYLHTATAWREQAAEHLASDLRGHRQGTPRSASAVAACVLPVIIALSVSCAVSSAGSERWPPEPATNRRFNKINWLRVQRSRKNRGYAPRSDKNEGHRRGHRSRDLRWGAL